MGRWAGDGRQLLHRQVRSSLVQCAAESAPAAAALLASSQPLPHSAIWFISTACLSSCPTDGSYHGGSWHPHPPHLEQHGEGGVNSRQQARCSSRPQSGGCSWGSPIAPDCMASGGCVRALP